MAEAVELDIIKNADDADEKHEEDVKTSRNDTDDIFYIDLSWHTTKNRDYLLFGLAVLCLILVSGISNFGAMISMSIQGGPLVVIIFIMAGLIGGKLMEDMEETIEEN